MLSYLNETLGLCATERPWDDADRLPLFLRSGRTYSVLTIENTDLLLIYLDVDQFQLSAFLKQRNKLLEFWKGDMVLCFRALTSYQRKVLIENHISCPRQPTVSAMPRYTAAGTYCRSPKSGFQALPAIPVSFVVFYILP